MEINLGTRDVKLRTETRAGRKELLQNGQGGFQILSGQLLKAAVDNRVSTKLRELSLWHIIRLLFAGGNSPGYRFEGRPALYGTKPGISADSISHILHGLELIPVFDSASLQYAEKSRRREMERSSFSVVGVVRTADGRKIQFQISVSMSKVFLEYYKEELQVGNAQLYEPLDIRLDLETAEISNQKFFFDIGGVVYQDEIYRLGGSYLDLDENDPAWSGVQIRCREENGRETLYRLVQKKFFQPFPAV